MEKKQLQGEIGDGKQLVDDVHESVMRGCGHAESTSYSFRDEAAKRIHAVGTVSRTTQRLRHLRGTNEKNGRIHGSISRGRVGRSGKPRKVTL